MLTASQMQDFNSTVLAALHELEQDGLIERLPDGRWRITDAGLASRCPCGGWAEHDSCPLD